MSDIIENEDGTPYESYSEDLGYDNILAEGQWRSSSFKILIATGADNSEERFLIKAVGKELSFVLRDDGWEGTKSNDYLLTLPLVDGPRPYPEAPKELAVYISMEGILSLEAQVFGPPGKKLLYQLINSND